LELVKIWRENFPCDDLSLVYTLVLGMFLQEIMINFTFSAD